LPARLEVSFRRAGPMCDGMSLGLLSAFLSEGFEVRQGSDLQVIES
jgi:hypothetical protein